MLTIVWILLVALGVALVSFTALVVIGIIWLNHQGLVNGAPWCWYEHRKAKEKLTLETAETR